MQNTIEKVLPRAVAVQLGDRTVSVSPIKFGQLPAVVRASAPILPHLQAGDYVGAITADPDAFLASLAALSGIPREDIDALELDQVLDLAGACVEVNLDFFFRAVAPRLEELASRVVNAIGSMPASN